MTAECAVIDLSIIYRDCHNCPLLNKYICTHSLRVPGHGVIKQIKILLTMVLWHSSVTSVVLGSCYVLSVFGDSLELVCM